MLRSRCARASSTRYRPDVLVARYSDLTEDGLPRAPVLAVEVISPSSRLRDAHLEKAVCARLGSPSFWLVDPARAKPSLTVFELADGAYREVACVAGDEAWTATSRSRSGWSRPIWSAACGRRRRWSAPRASPAAGLPPGITRQWSALSVTASGPRPPPEPTRAPHRLSVCSASMTPGPGRSRPSSPPGAAASASTAAGRRCTARPTSATCVPTCWPT
ncbi:MAG: Uma2 family endonuclease [Streptosporangiaceae bacterium]